MIIFVSDLHLADRVERSPMSVRRFLDTLEETAGRSVRRGVHSLVLMLLGDIFELLGSEKWLDTDVRPWNQDSAGQADVLASIFEAISVAHSEFFDGLNQLVSDYSDMQLQYVPGNHDRGLNEASEAVLVLSPVPDSVLRLVSAVDSARFPCGHGVAPLTFMMDRDPRRC